MEIIHSTGRNNCGGRCVVHFYVEEGNIIRTATDCEADAAGGVPLKACARGMHYADTYLNDRRLKTPLLRVGKRGEGKFRPVSWEEAVDYISREWIRIRDTYGPGSRYVNYATGVSALLSPSRLAKRLLSLDGGFLDYYNSYSTACIHKTTELMYGTIHSGSTPEQWLNSRLIILWGHNPKETVFDASTMYYLKKARDQGIPIIVIDPRKSDTVDVLQAEWIPIRPSTDAALQDAMAYVIYTGHLQDQEFLNRCCLGFDPEHMPEGIDPQESYVSYLTGVRDGVPKTPAWAEGITGVPQEQIISLARRFAGAKPAALIQGFGPQRNAYGEQSVRGGILLACMTGNVGIPGGWASGSGVWQRHKMPALPPVKNPYGRKIPVYRWTDAVLRGRSMNALDGVVDERTESGEARLDSDIKMILNLAGNCLINQHGDINRTRKILEDPSKVELIVCSDLFLTASAKYADILLPGISFLEGENITMPWSVGDFLGYNNQVVKPLFEGRFEYDWLAEVAKRLGLREAFTENRSSGEWLQYLYEELRKEETELPDFAEFKEKGICRYQNHPSIIAFQKQREDPDHYPFPTGSGKIEIFSPRVFSGEFQDPFPAIPGYVEPEEGVHSSLREHYPLQLLGWHTRRRCHSIHDNNPAMESLDPQQLWIHPADAAERGITDGQQVLVYNGRGKTRIKAKVTDRIMQGVTALAQGAWYQPDAEGVDQNGSINVLTSLHPTPYARGNGQHTNLVEVTTL